MTLENDIHRVLESHGSLRPCEIITILQEMPQYKSKAEVDWFKVNVSKALRHLKDENIVKESLTKGKHAYRVNTLTEKGRKLAPQAAISNIVELPLDISMKIEYPGVIKPSIDRSKLKNRSSDFKVLEILDRVQPKGNAFMDVALWFDKPKGGKSKLSTSVQENLQKSISDSISLFGGAFINPLKQANIDAKNARYHWEGFDSGPLLTQKIIEQEKAALDFEAVMVIRFNGKKIITEIDWNQEIEKVKEMDKKAAEEYEKYRQTVIKEGPEQQKWLAEKTKEIIRNSEFQLGKFLNTFDPLRTEEIHKDPWKFLNSEEKLKNLLVNKFVEDIILKKEQIINDPSERPLFSENNQVNVNSEDIKVIKKEVEKTLQELVDSGIVEVTKVYLFKFKEDQKMARPPKENSVY